jgi:signal transduction histidine kinase
MTAATSAWEADGIAARKADVGQRPIRVLLVEDDEDDYQLTRDLLREMEKQRFTLDWVATFEDAVEAMDRQKYDVYLVDYRLGVHNGLELLTQADCKGVPVILLTGLDDWDVDIQAAKAGAADYLVKGKIEPALLERSIRYAIERKRAEEALKQADRRKDEFLAMLAHELRNPLAPVLTALETMGLRDMGDPDQQRAREIIERQVHQMTRLVDDLLDVSRITRGKIKLQAEPVDLATVVARAVEVSRPLIDARHHHLTVTLPDHPVLLDADMTRLAQVVTNLLNNAAKYTERGGQIRLTVQKEGEEAVVRVRDTGVGIAKELLPQVFGLFTQLDRSLDRSQGGLGIGLTLARRLVEMHGGTIQAFSDGPGQGSEFVVRLPALAHMPTVRKVSRPPEPMLAAAPPQRILIADDNEDFADIMARLLRCKGGHEVQVVYDGRAALRILQTFRPEVAFLDIGLPGIDGYELAHRLRQLPGLEEVMLVALTGYGHDEDRRRALEVGFDEHLTKPVGFDTLQRLLAARAVAAGV